MRKNWLKLLFYVFSHVKTNYCERNIINECDFFGKSSELLSSL